MSSKAVPYFQDFLARLMRGGLLAALLGSASLTAQDDTAASGTASASAQRPRERINVLVTVPRGEVNQAQVQECEDRADASAISGEIVVCRQTGQDPANTFSNPEEARKRYAEATANKNSPPPPNVFGIGDGNFKFGFGGAPPPALIIDVGALPQAPAGSDADRIARGLPPKGQELELTEEQEKARREALGVKPAPQLILPPSTPKRKR